MYIRISLFAQNFMAEIYKIKRTPLLWLALLGGILIAGIIFLSYYFDHLDVMTPPGVNPWKVLIKRSIHAIALFLIPYVVLLNGGLLHYEHQSNAWKFLYSLPVKRANVYFSKLLVALFLLTLTYTVFFLCILLTGLILGLSHPEFEFYYYTPSFGSMIQIFFHSFISVLGIMGLQYWFSMRWKSFIAPIGMGLLGFILTLIVFNHNHISVYFPYCFPVSTSFYLGGRDPLSLGVKQWGVLSNVEWYSLICFIISALLGFWEENRREVK